MSTRERPTVLIERAQERDIFELAQMYAEDMRTLDFDRKPADLLPLVKATLAEQGKGVHTFVARVEGAGLAGVLLADAFWSLKVSGRALWIEELYVRPDFRRLGIGVRLVEHLLEWAEGAGYLGVELEAYRMNTAASLLYRELDFKRLARERYCYYFSEE